jgi:AcrR family transcriptional regulator
VHAMPTRSKLPHDPSKEPRKSPRQLRSEQTRRDLLSGATRVLQKRGASGLTTNHIAEATGLSIGSLYQYYPNKAALLVDLHAEDMGRLWQEILGILSSDALPARVRLTAMLELAFVAQAQASEHHAALSDAAVDVTQTAEFEQVVSQAKDVLQRFVAQEAAPSADTGARVEVSLTTVLALLSELGRTPREPEAARQLACETACMLGDYLRLPS